MPLACVLFITAAQPFLHKTGVAPEKLRRTPSLSALDELVMGRDSDQQQQCFVFMLKVRHAALAHNTHKHMHTVCSLLGWDLRCAGVRCVLDACLTPPTLSTVLLVAGGRQLPAVRLLLVRA